MLGRLLRLAATNVRTVSSPTLITAHRFEAGALSRRWCLGTTRPAPFHNTAAASLLAARRPTLGLTASALKQPEALTGLFAGLSTKSSWVATTLTAAGLAAWFQDMGLWSWLIVDVGIQWAGWAVSTLLKTDKLYDLLGTSSFVALTAGSLAVAAAHTPRKILVSCMTGVWALRLGAYLVARVHKAGKDSRFDEWKHQPAMFLFVWSMQALWVFSTVSPVLIVNTATRGGALKWWDAAGVALWALGLAIESIADAQKDAWRSHPANKGKFINEGLWSLSRHPNYFGEMLLWWGIFAVCVPAFTRPQHYISVCSPLLVMLLLRYVSGVPILERQAETRWGGQPEYETYKANTPLLIPDLGRLLTGKWSHRA